MSRRTLGMLLLAALATGACNEGSSREEPLEELDAAADDTGGQDATGGVDVPADQASSDTASPDTDATLADTSDPDLAGDTIATDPCQGPLRLSPPTVGSAGGELVVVEGQDFYIGALDWIFAIEDQVAFGPDWGGGSGEPASPCQLVYRMPPVAPGRYAVSVYYGDPGHGQSPPPGGLELEVVAATRHWTGAESCSLADSDCPFGQHCEIGLGFCAFDDCPGWTSCANTGLTCDPLEGCRTPAPPACTANSDCAMLYSLCGCMAVHASDPRAALPQPQLTACELDACQELDCNQNTCDAGGYFAACDTTTGRCIELPPL